MTPAWVIRTGRLLLSPVGWQDLPDLCALKGDPLVFGQMLGGVRSPVQVAEELAQEAAFWPAHGVGMWLAREAAGAALRFAHDQAGLRRVVAVTRDSNFSSRVLLGAIGMRPCATFERDGHPMLVFESVATRPPAGAWR